MLSLEEVRIEGELKTRAGLDTNRERWFVGEKKYGYKPDEFCCGDLEDYSLGGRDLLLTDANQA
jgi:hypothetical protein